jgi:hypothetical protein
MKVLDCLIGIALEVLGTFVKLGSETALGGGDIGLGGTAVVALVFLTGG